MTGFASPKPPMMLRATAAKASADNVGGIAFVVLWSTGYIAAAYALQGSGPFTLAVLRFTGSALIIGLWLLWRAARQADRRSLLHAAIGGVMLQAGFFGFMYAGLRAGVPAAAAGLITGLMPLTTALGAALLLREPLHRQAAWGLLVGLLGVLLVIGPELRAPASLLGYGAIAAALASLSLGTLYQKRHASMLDPRLALLAQLIASALVLLPFAAGLEGLHLRPTLPVLSGLAWAIVVNSCCGLLLYLWLLSRGAAGRVASLFYLVPPVTALLAALMLDSHFTLADGLGFALAAFGVWLGQR